MYVVKTLGIMTGLGPPHGALEQFRSPISGLVRAYSRPSPGRPPECTTKQQVNLQIAIGISRFDHRQLGTLNDDDT